MDISILKAIASELAGILPGSKLSEIEEGPSGELYLFFRPGGRILLIAPRPALPRIHLTVSKPKGSRELSPFAQSLRNHVIGAEVESIAQSGLERSITIYLNRKRGENLQKYALVFEMAGKKPNLMLLDEGGRITIAQSYVSISDEAARPILPGLTYQPPPKPDKLDPDAVTTEDIADIFRDNPAMPPEKALFMKVGGISPLLAREAVADSGTDNPDAVAKSLRGLLVRLEKGPYSPGIYKTKKGPVLAAFPMRQFEGLPHEKFKSMSGAADAYYSMLTGEQEFTAAKAALVRELKGKLTAARKKHDAIREDMARSEKADEYQLFGQTLMASLDRTPKGADTVTLPNVYSPDETLKIPLAPKLSPVKNAEAYFSKAKKARAGALILKKRLEAATDEAERFDTLLERAEMSATVEEVQAISGKPAREAKKPKKGKAEAAPFPSFVSSDGFEVLYAKNAKMNDMLTFKVAQPMDMWFHVQGYHGGHVIVRNPERRPDIPLNTILEAAATAAYFSGAKKDSSVAVDYTFRKHVRKPRDPVPGQAIFTNNKTVFVEPKKR